MSQQTRADKTTAPRLWLLNTDRTPAQWRNHAFSNIAMAACTLAFAALAVNEIRQAIAGF